MPRTASMTRRATRVGLWGLGVVGALWASLSHAQPAAFARATVIGSRGASWAGATRDGTRFGVWTIAEGLDRLTALTSLPDGRLLIAETGGRVRQVVDGQLHGPPLFTWSGAVIHGMVADPNFERTAWLYMAARIDERWGPSTKIVRFRVGVSRLFEAAVIVDDLPGGPLRAGALRLGPGGDLYLGTEDRPERSAAQDLGDGAGKILRFTRDGRPTGGASGFGFVHAWGFSDARVFAWDLRSQVLWHMERLPDGTTTDVNRVVPRTNYGWSGPGVAEVSAQPPIFRWSPGSQPLAAVVYDGLAFPNWRGDLVIAAAGRPGLLRVPSAVLGVPIGVVEGWLQDAGHVFDLTEGSDGAIYAVIREDRPLAGSRVIRIAPLVETDRSPPTANGPRTTR